MPYHNFREKAVTETNYIRPRWVAEGVGRDLKGLIVTREGPDKGSICWGIVDGDDNFVYENQQLLYNPWTGKKLPATMQELHDIVFGNYGRA